MTSSHLRGAFRKVCRALEREKRNSPWSEPVGVNAKRDTTRVCDVRAEQAIEHYCIRHIAEPVCLISEERGTWMTKPGIPRERWVMDPLDGSENFARRLKYSGVAIAALPYDRPLVSSQVTTALIGEIQTERAYLATRRQGKAVITGKRIRVSRTRKLRDALIGCDWHFTKRPPQKCLFRLVHACKDIRRLGSTVVELMCVADGRYDAYVDIRNELTAEDFLAASLVIEAAGGCITDRQGCDWGEIRNLTQRFTVIAAATIELHEAILHILNQ